jgi:hypothetical protein
MKTNWLQPIYWHRRDLGVAALVLSVTLTIFLLSPNQAISDSRFTFVLSESLLRYRSFTIDHFALPQLEPRDNGYYFRNGDIYQQEWSNGHLYYYHPPGSSVLSVPYVAVMHLFGLSCINSDGTYNLENEMELQRILAGLLMAVSAVIFYYTARLLLPLKWSAIVAFGGALGTPLWSTLSRGVWSDTWSVFLFSIVVFLLLADTLGSLKLNPFPLATLLAWTYFVRPTNAVAIAAITVYIVLYRRQIFLWYAVVGFIWFAAFVTYSRSHFKTWLPAYYRASRLSFEHFGEALAGNLISPARGFLIYVPVIFFAVYLLVHYRRVVVNYRLLWLAVIISFLYWVANSSFPHWWGGYSYGPRLMADIVPWIVMLTILGIDALRRAPLETRSWAGPVQAAIGALLLLVSIGMNGIGAVMAETVTWNEHPTSVDKDPSRLWDWRYPQFLAGFLHPPLPGEFPPADVRIEFSRTSAEPYLWYGWSVNEPQFRWTNAREAAIIFGLDDISDAEFFMKVSPLIVANKLDQQRLNIHLNNQPLTTLTLTQPIEQELSVPLPERMLRTNNTLVFDLPDARTPKSLGLNQDQRKLALAVFWMEVRTPRGRKKTEEKTIARGPLLSGGYVAQIEPIDAPARLPSGKPVNLRVRVKNMSGITWPSDAQADGSFKVQLGNHWLDANGKKLQIDDGRAALPFDIAPGGEVELLLTVTTPGSPSDYILELDMVQERVNWFADEDSQPARIKITVF